MQKLINFIKQTIIKSDSFTKDDLMDFKNYWQCKQSPFGFIGEDEIIYTNWIYERKRIKNR
jgi:AAA15 family ATPase/GTPase